jgi:hypothetical protein
VAGLVVLAPHIFVEDVTVANIELARTAYLHRPAAEARPLPRQRRLGLLGLEPIWLHPPFRNGTSRPSSTRSAARCWRSRASTTNTARSRRSAASLGACRKRELLEIPECGHSPHRDQPGRVITETFRSSPKTGDITMTHALSRTARLMSQALATSPSPPWPGARPARRAAAKLKVGLMLPYSGTYTALGVAIENGFKLYVDEQGGKLGGREIEYVKVDDESDPAKATDNVNKLIKRDNVDVIVGTVHSAWRWPWPRRPRKAAPC